VPGPLRRLPRESFAKKCQREKRSFPWVAASGEVREKTTGTVNVVQLNGGECFSESQKATTLEPITHTRERCLKLQDCVIATIFP